MKRIYIATPINARKERTLPDKVVAAENRIRTIKQVLKDEPMFKGCKFVSTFDLPHDPEDVSEARAIGDCVAAVLECDAIYLDHGWLQSKGCNLEYRAAKIYGLEIYEHDKL